MLLQQQESGTGRGQGWGRGPPSLSLQDAWGDRARRDAQPLLPWGPLQATQGLSWGIREGGPWGPSCALPAGGSPGEQDSDLKFRP